MKHFKLKVFILIGILLLSLSSVWVMIYYPQNYIRLSASDIAVTERVLKRRGVTIEAGAIPKKVKSMPRVTMSGSFDNSSDIADIIFTDGYEQKGKVSFKDNVKIRLNPEISIKANPPVLSDEFKNVTSKNAVKKIRDILNDYNFDIADSILETYENNDDELSVIVTQKYADYPVFNNALRFTISQKGLSSVTGLWFEPDASGGKKHKPKSPVDVLIDFSDDRNNEGTHIISLTQGYRIDAQGEAQMQAELIPTWRILTDNGEIYYSDF